MGGEGDDRGWDGWMASPTQWTWVWVSSRSWWWTEKPGLLQSMGLQRVRQGWATGVNWTEHAFGWSTCMFPMPTASNQSIPLSPLWRFLTPLSAFDSLPHVSDGDWIPSYIKLWINTCYLLSSGWFLFTSIHPWETIYSIYFTVYELLILPMETFLTSIKPIDPVSSIAGNKDDWGIC